MKKSIYSLLAVAAVLCGCQSNESLDVKAPSGKKMTLTASIASQTKVVYEEEMTNAGLSLKATWSDKDTISIVSYDAEGKILAIDDFVCEGAAGHTKAVFTGSISDYDNASSLVAVYPKLGEDGWNKMETAYATDENGAFVYMWSIPTMVEEKSDLETLADACVLLGKPVEVEDGELSVNLEHQTALVKLSVKFPQGYEGIRSDEFQLWHYSSRGAKKNMLTVGLYDVAAGSIYGYSYSISSYPQVTVNHWSVEEGCNHYVNEDGVLEAYFILFPQTFSSGDFLVFQNYLDDQDESLFYTEYQFTGSNSLQAGKVYTFSIDTELYE